MRMTKTLIIKKAVIHVSQRNTLPHLEGSQAFIKIGMGWNETLFFALLQFAREKCDASS